MRLPPVSVACISPVFIASALSATAPIPLTLAPMSSLATANTAPPPGTLAQNGVNSALGLHLQNGPPKHTMTSHGRLLLGNHTAAGSPDGVTYGQANANNPPSSNPTGATHGHAPASGGPPPGPTESYGIKEVFAYNLEEEMRKMNKLVKKYPFIAIDTEFPGVVARPCGVFNTNSDYEYALFKVNVDLMKIIQLGLSFFNEQGQQPTPIHTWQFNFRFNLSEEMYAQDSIKLLMHSGIQFSLHESMGIEPDHFAERLITSNIVCNDHVRFLTFHSAYDFGYLLKVLEGSDSLPRNEGAFLEKLKMFFPHIFDIKHMIRDQRTLKGGLQDLANQFQLARVGAQHQAGSDSALTGALFFRLREEVFHGKLDEFSGRLFGLTGNFGDRVHHLENVVIKENVKGGNSSPVTGILSALTAAHEERQAAAAAQADADKAAGHHHGGNLSVSTSSSNTAASAYHGSVSAPILNHNNHPVNTFTFLTNVNVPHRFYEDPAGYMVTTTTSTGEYVVSNDPQVLHSQHQQHYGAPGQYYDNNGY